MGGFAAAGPAGTSLIFIELGIVVLGLSLLARAAMRLGLSPIPLYLLAGLLLGEGGLVDVDLSEDFISVGASIGLILLLLALGLEYTPTDLQTSLRAGLPAGVADLVLNFAPGVAAGVLLGWGPVAGVLLGGVTYVSSSGIVAKVLSDLGRLGNRETPTVLSILVMEDLAMAVYLPVVSVVLAGTGLVSAAASVGVAVATVAAVLLVSLRHGTVVERLIFSRSDEVVLLGVLGLALLVAGVAERLQVSAAVGAFLVGLAVPAPVSERAGALIGPLRDLFAATFFLFFALEIDPASLVPVLLPAAVLAVVTAGTKLITGWWAAARAGVAVPGRSRAGTALVARGEFSVVIAGLGVAAGAEPRLGPLVAAYVLLLAVAGPVLARWSDPVARVAAPLLRRPARVP